MDISNRGGGNSTIFDKKENVICGYANPTNLAKKEADAARRRPYKFDVDGRFTDQE